MLTLGYLIGNDIKLFYNFSVCSKYLSILIVNSC